MWQAAADDHLTRLRKALKAGADPSIGLYLSKATPHPLFYSALASTLQVKVALALLKAGADIQGRRPEKEGLWGDDGVPPATIIASSPLGMALQRGDVEMVDVLVTHGARYQDLPGEGWWDVWRFTLGLPHESFRVEPSHPNTPATVSALVQRLSDAGAVPREGGAKVFLDLLQADRRPQGPRMKAVPPCDSGVEVLLTQLAATDFDWRLQPGESEAPVVVDASSAVAALAPKVQAHIGRARLAAQLSDAPAAVRRPRM